MKIKGPLARCLEKGREPFPIKSVCRVVVDGLPQGWAGGKVSLLCRCQGQVIGGCMFLIRMTIKGSRQSTLLMALKLGLGVLSSLSLKPWETAILHLFQSLTGHWGKVAAWWDADEAEGPTLVKKLVQLEGCITGF